MLVGVVLIALLAWLGIMLIQQNSPWSDTTTAPRRWPDHTR